MLNRTLWRIERLNDRAEGDVVALTPAGMDLLAARHTSDSEAMVLAAPRARAIQNLDHAIAIGRLYAALAAELRYRGHELTGWRGDHLLARGAYDRVVVVGGREPLPILPDATFGRLSRSIAARAHCDHGRRRSRRMRRIGTAGCWRRAMASVISRC